MKYAATDEMIAIPLSEGDEIGNCIAHVCRSCDVDSAVIVGGAGMVSTLTFGWYNGRDYNTEAIREVVELAALSGNVSYKGTGIYVHIHGVFNRPDHHALSGHILNAVVFNNAEIFLKTLTTIRLGREFDGSFEALSPEKRI